MLLRRTTLSFGALALTALALSACGSSKKSSSTATPASTPAAASTTSSSTSGGGSSNASAGALTLGAVESNGLAFSEKTLTAKAGSVTVTLDNASGNAQPHGVAVEGNGVDKDSKVVQPGSTASVTLTLKPGKYTFYCPVPGHRAAGMVGTLTVQ
jgi:uncharacterized cupredoxin-like copper-binding protein